MFLASASPGFSEIAGIITTTTIAMPRAAITPAWWVTRCAHRAQGPASASACEMKRCGITRTRLMPVPMIASIAGSSVQAAIPDTIGIRTPRHADRTDERDRQNHHGQQSDADRRAGY